MKKKIYNLPTKRAGRQFTIYKIFALLFLFLILFTKILTAQEASDSADFDPEVKEKIKEKLEKVVDQDLENIKGTLTEKIANKIYGYSGEIINIKDNVLTVNTYKGNFDVKIASGAAIIKYSDDKTKTNIEADEIEKNDFVIAMGPKQEDDTILGKRLIISPPPSPPPARKILFGKVTEIDKSKVKFSQNGDEQTIAIGSKTKLKINSMEKPSTEDIQIGDYLYTIVTLDEDEDIDEVKAVLVLPGTSSPAAEENTVEEATPASETKEESSEE